MVSMRHIVVDCEHAPSLARFWAAALDGYAVRPYDDAEVARLASLGLTPDTDPTVLVDGSGPSLLFQQVPEPQTVRNRLRLDLVSANRAAEVERLLSLGASVERVLDDCTVLHDPEHNEFRVLDS